MSHPFDRFDQSVQLLEKCPELLEKCPEPLEKRPDTKAKILVAPLPGGGKQAYVITTPNLTPPPKAKVITPQEVIFFGLVVYVMHKIHKFLEKTKP